MKKEQAENYLEPENRTGMSKWEARLVFCGISAVMTSPVTINYEAIKLRNDAVKIMDNDKEDEIKPRKPPRRPNAPARFALGST
jgi:hypothetical protein